MDKIKNIQIYGVELPVFLFFFVVVSAAAYLDIIPNQMIGAAAILFTMGIILGEIGERIPLWNKYCGGGVILDTVDDKLC